jgi:hypothetical protein
MQSGGKVQQTYAPLSMDGHQTMKTPGNLFSLSKRRPVLCLVVFGLFAGEALAGEIDFSKLKEKPDPFKDLPGVTVQEPVSNLGPQKYNCITHLGFAKDTSNGLRKPIEIMSCTQGNLTFSTSRDLEN